MCFLAAIHRSSIEMITWQDAYVEQLLEPRDWFSFWRLNCSLARYSTTTICIITVPAVYHNIVSSLHSLFCCIHSLHSMLGRKEGYEYVGFGGSQITLFNASMHVGFCYFNGRNFSLQENKWTFLVDGKSKGIPVSPFLDIPSLVIKDKVMIDPFLRPILPY